MMQQEFDPLGIGSYMISRMRELLGTDFLGAEPFEVPRFALNEPTGFFEEPSSSFYVNPEIEWAFPEAELLPVKGPAVVGEKARGHRQLTGGGTEILESTNTRPARPPRRLFRVDVTENDDYYFLRADLAGMTKENVSISVVEDQNLVSINVEPPKDDFFGLYKSPLESQSISVNPEQQRSSIKEEEVKRMEEKGPEEEKIKENVPVEANKPAESKVEEPAKKETEISHKKEICHLIERCTQGMSRSLKMPKAVDMKKIEAEMRDGLLVVKFSKKRVDVEEGKKHLIEIK